MSVDLITPLCWSGLHGERVELTIAGYEFPDIDEGYDANWIKLEASFENEQGRWTRATPCLLTWELEWLHRWLRAAVDGDAERDLGFLEPDLKLQFLGCAQGRICFAILADYALSFSVKAQRDASLIVARITSTELESSLSTISEWMERFPGRGKLGREAPNLFPGPRLIKFGH